MAAVPAEVVPRKRVVPPVSAIEVTPEMSALTISRKPPLTVTPPTIAAWAPVTPSCKVPPVTVVPPL